MSKPTTPVVEKAPQRGKVGNRNGLTSGLYSFFTTGRFPKGASYIARLLREMRQALEVELVKAHGELSLANAAAVQTACRHEGRALLLQRMLHDETLSVTVDQRLSILRDISAASEARDRVLARAGLTRETSGSVWAAFFGGTTAGPLPPVPPRPAIPAGPVIDHDPGPSRPELIGGLVEGGGPAEDLGGGRNAP
jgi:hypothetical protein